MDKKGELQFPFVKLTTEQRELGIIPNFRAVVAVVPYVFSEPDNRWHVAAGQLYWRLDEDELQKCGFHNYTHPELASRQEAYLDVWMRSNQPSPEQLRQVMAWLLSYMLVEPPANIAALA